MIHLLVLMLILLSALSALFDYADFASIWQQKEYRLDRMKDFWGTAQGKKFFIRYPFIRGVLAFVLFFFLPKEPVYFFPALAVVFGADLIRIALQVLHHQVKRPKLTLKALLLIGFSFGFEVALLVTFNFWAVLLIILFRFDILSGIAIIAGIPTKAWRKKQIAGATKKMHGLRNLRVIGITGSYGKSSTKEILAHMLSEKFRVVKTPENTNSEIGVAEFVLRTDFVGVDFFICEMGAYTRGEIKTIADMVRPTVGVLTTVGEEHLSLFGSKENIAKTKYELLESIPKEGLVVTNGDNEFCTARLGELSAKRQKLFGEVGGTHLSAIILEKESTLDGTRGKIQIGGVIHDISLPVPGAHQIVNVAPALLVVEFLGLSLSEAVASLKTLPMGTHGSLKTFRIKNAIGIDDTYNSNPRGFISALELVAKTTGTRRVVVTRGMMELGNESEAKHREVGAKIAKLGIDEVLIISPDSKNALVEGIGNGATKIVSEYDHAKILERVKKYTESAAVILFENRLPKNVSEWVKKNTQ